MCEYKRFMNEGPSTTETFKKRDEIVCKPEKVDYHDEHLQCQSFPNMQKDPIEV